MEDLTHYPVLLCVVSFFVLWFCAKLGRHILLRQHSHEKELRNDFNTILAATLTLLGLIIGFSFSMAANRYDLRRTYEEAEANAIGTEYLRVELLPAADMNRMQALLRDYLDQRIMFYQAPSEAEAEQINARTTVLQNELWSIVRAPATAQPNPVTALVVSGINDVLNAEGYAQAGFWNRIPRGAWLLMLMISVGANLLVGYGSRSVTAGTTLLPILPLLVAIAFMLIADIDAPRHGIIRVKPLNLISLYESIHPNPAAHGAANAP